MEASTLITKASCRVRIQSIDADGLKQRMIAERFRGLDEGLVRRDRRAIREKIETEPKIRNWFQDLARLSI